MADSYRLDFEQPLAELERKIDELRRLARDHKKVNLTDELKTMEAKLDRLRHDTYQHLTAWQRVQIARHPQRPFTRDYVERLIDGFVELHGDRLFGDDQALTGGFGALEGQP